MEAHRRSAIFLVLLLAAVLRAQQIDQPYVDAYAWRQADTASIADAFADGDWNILMPQVRWGGRGPNYIGAEFQTVSAIAAVAYRLVGPAPWVGRAVSIAFGLWGIFALYHLVRRVWDTPRGIAAAAVMAVLPGSVFVERSFLPDGAMTALMTTSLWMLVAYGQDRRRSFLVAATLAGTLGCLTKLPGAILVVPALYAVVALFGPSLRERAVRVPLAVAAAAVAVPVAAYYALARHVALSRPPYHMAGGGKFIWDAGLRAWLDDRYYLPELWRLALEDLWGWPFLVLAAAGVVLACRPKRRAGAPWLFHAWLAALAVRYAVEARHLVTDPYNLHLYDPVVAAFAGYALVRLAEGSRPFRGETPRAALAALLFAGAGIFGHVGGRHAYASTHRDHQLLGEFVAERSSPGDLVITMGQEPVALYFSRRNGWVFPPYATRGAWDYGDADLATLRDLEAQGGRWVVIPSWNDYTGGSGEDFLRRRYPALYAGLLADYEIVHDAPEGMVLRAR